MGRPGRKVTTRTSQTVVANQEEEAAKQTVDILDTTTLKRALDESATQACRPSSCDFFGTGRVNCRL
jgi:hypothetical protein